ncbi:hypothetical protein VNO77_34173 [Canavalia gladiata]|uniref:Uncharacterized protein n=1 Tax=Canavalia gladiata TaxID=3824 RepID=A0AAN9KFR2_CANGL
MMPLVMCENDVKPEHVKCMELGLKGTTPSVDNEVTAMRWSCRVLSIYELIFGNTNIDPCMCDMNCSLSDLEMTPRISCNHFGGPHNCICYQCMAQFEEDMLLSMLPNQKHADMKLQVLRILEHVLSEFDFLATILLAKEIAYTMPQAYNNSSHTKLSMWLLNPNLNNKRRAETAIFSATSFGPSIPKDHHTSTFAFPMNTLDSKHECDLELGETTSGPSHGCMPSTLMTFLGSLHNTQHHLKGLAAPANEALHGFHIDLFVRKVTCIAGTFDHKISKESGSQAQNLEKVRLARDYSLDLLEIGAEFALKTRERKRALRIFWKLRELEREFPELVPLLPK